MKATDFLLENDVMGVLHHIKRFSPTVSRYTAYMTNDPKGKYVRYDDANAVLSDHPDHGHIERLMPTSVRSGYNFTANVVEDPKGQFVRLHDVINLISGMAR